MAKIRAAIFGAAGYGGVELYRLLANHPDVEVTFLAGHTTAGQPMDEAFGHLFGIEGRTINESDIDKAAEQADVVFLALPHRVSQDYAARALDAGMQVVDFSADFRLKDQREYVRFYGEHRHWHLVDEAVYGLPELHRQELAGARLIAVPGCYPTGAILALAPAVKAKLIWPEGIVVDAKSGVSGAGRTKFGLTTHFAEVNESVAAYSVASHRHNPEIDQELSLLGGPVHVTFVPHLIPMTRGILTTCYARLEDGVDEAQVREAYEEFYSAEPFVDVLPAGKMPATKHVWFTNRCLVGLAVDEQARTLVAVSAIDNLIKGLAGAAVQSFNISRGLDEAAGLQIIPPWP